MLCLIALPPPLSLLFVLLLMFNQTEALSEGSVRPSPFKHYWCIGRTTNLPPPPFNIKLLLLLLFVGLAGCSTNGRPTWLGILELYKISEGLQI